MGEENTIPEAPSAPTVLLENLIKENRELACILGASIRLLKPKPPESINNQ